MRLTGLIVAIDLPLLWGLWLLSFTPTDVSTIIGALVILVPVIAAAIGAVLKSISSMRQELRQDKVDTVAKLEVVLAKTDVIAGHVNSAASKADEIIKSQETQLEMQRATITTMEKTAALLAQARASSEALAAMTASPPAAGPPDV